MLGRGLETLDGVLHRRVGGALLELDDVGARDGSSDNRLDQRSRKCQRQDRSQGKEVMHLEGGWRGLIRSMSMAGEEGVEKIEAEGLVVRKD